MKNELIVLDENDIVYIFEDMVDDYDNKISRPTLRVENIKGDMCISMLPRFFIVEKDAKTYHTTDKLNYNFATADTGHNLIVKKSKKTGEIGIVHYDHERDFPHLSSDEYYQLVTLHAQSKFNPKFDSTPMSFAWDIVDSVVDTLDLDYECIYYCNEEEIVDILFEQLSKSHTKRINSVTKDSEME